MSDKPKRPDLENECDAHRYTVDMLEHICDQQQDIMLVQVKQAADIEHHIERTDQLQDIVGGLAKSVSSLEATKQQLMGALKLILSGSAILALMQLAKFFL